MTGIMRHKLFKKTVSQKTSFSVECQTNYARKSWGKRERERMECKKSLPCHFLNYEKQAQRYITVTSFDNTVMQEFKISGHDAQAKVMCWVRIPLFLCPSFAGHWTWNSRMWWVNSTTAPNFHKLGMGIVQLIAFLLLTQRSWFPMLLRFIDRTLLSEWTVRSLMVGQTHLVLISGNLVLHIGTFDANCFWRQVEQVELYE